MILIVLHYIIESIVVTCAVEMFTLTMRRLSCFFPIQYNYCLVDRFRMLI